LGRYEVAEVGERQGVVRLACTDVEEAQEILAEVQGLFPDWRVRPQKEYASDSGEEMGWQIDKCEGRHRYALWWLVRRLGSSGWEPFALAHQPAREPYAGPVYLFRKESRP
jgi:hypothetical protein